jgi:hypothetical protein
MVPYYCCSEKDFASSAISKNIFFCNKKAKLNPDVVWDGGLALSLKRIFNYKLDYGFIASRFMISP